MHVQHMYMPSHRSFRRGPEPPVTESELTLPTFIKVNVDVDVGETERATIRREIDASVVSRVRCEVPLAISFAPEMIDAAFAVGDDDVVSKLDDALVMEKFFPAIEVFGRI